MILKCKILVSLIFIIFVIVNINCSGHSPSKSEFSIPEFEFQKSYKKIAIFPSEIFLKKIPTEKEEKRTAEGGSFSSDQEKKEESLKAKKERSLSQYGSIDENLKALDSEIVFRIISSKAFENKEIMLPKDSEKIIANIMRSMKLKHFYDDKGYFSKTLFMDMIKKFCEITKSDAVLVNFLEIVEAKVESNVAEWDGKKQDYANSSYVKYYGSVAALSLTGYMIDTQGKYIWEGRGGLTLLQTKYEEMTIDPESNLNIFKILNDIDLRRNAVKNVFYSLKIK